MNKVASILGKTATTSAKKIAVVRCSGSCDERPRTNLYDGVSNCTIAAALYGGETGCSFGCFGLGDCETSCTFDAIHINPFTRLPEVVEDKCTACGACVKACPKDIIELRKQGPKSRRIYVSCVNRDKGAVARKACNVACRLQQMPACPFEAITIAKITWHTSMTTNVVSAANAFPYVLQTPYWNSTSRRKKRLHRH